MRVCWNQEYFSLKFFISEGSIIWEREREKETWTFRSQQVFKFLPYLLGTERLCRWKSQSNLAKPCSNAYGYFSSKIEHATLSICTVPKPRTKDKISFKTVCKCLVDEEVPDECTLGSKLADSKRKENHGKLTTDILSVLQVLMFFPIFLLVFTFNGIRAVSCFLYFIQRV